MSLTLRNGWPKPFYPTTLSRMCSKGRGIYRGRVRRCGNVQGQSVLLASASRKSSSGQAWVPLPGAEHPAILRSLLESPGMTSRLVPDAHLAALAIEHGLTLYSTDGDFARFAGLDWDNPLAAGSNARN